MCWDVSVGIVGYPSTGCPGKKDTTEIKSHSLTHVPILFPIHVLIVQDLAKLMSTVMRRWKVVCLPSEMVNMTISHLQAVLVLELIRRKAAHIEYLL